MRKRHNPKPTMTGPDYLAGIAQRAANQGHPYAQQFANMVFSAFAGQNHLPDEVAASRPLREHERAPVAIIQASLQACAEANDRESYNEIFEVGLHLLAKWDHYLALTTGHPTLELKGDR